jgi:hypothetical protein
MPAYRIAIPPAPYCSAQDVRYPMPNRDKLTTVSNLRVDLGANGRVGTVLALSARTEEVCMFAISAILIGVVGVIYVRRRSSRKKQQAV